jgi:hypothetical protein
MARALKTFQAHLGFYDTIVAAPSQAAALKAWGSRRDLFREGFAKICDEPGAIAAASAKPGIVLRRAAGSKAPFSENPALPQIPNVPKPPKPAAKKIAKEPPAKAAPEKRKAQKEPPPLPTPPQPKPAPRAKPGDRRGIETAEKSIAKVKTDEARALAALEKRKNALSQEERRIREDFRNQREKAEQKLVQARRAYAAALNRR